MADLKHPWHVGELCLKDGIAGVVWRVIDIEPKPGSFPILWIKPVFDALRPEGCGEVRTTETRGNCCTPMPLLDLCQVRATFDLFLGAEARRLGGDLPSWPIDPPSLPETLKDEEGSDIPF